MPSQVRIPNQIQTLFLNQAQIPEPNQNQNSNWVTRRFAPQRASAAKTKIRSLSAEREGFEPSVQLPVHMISSHAPSAARSPLQVWCLP